MEHLQPRTIDGQHVQGACPSLVSGRLPQPSSKNGGHRALADIIESLDELRYYRSKAFMAPTRRTG